MQAGNENNNNGGRANKEKDGKVRNTVFLKLLEYTIL